MYMEGSSGCAPAHDVMGSTSNCGRDLNAVRPGLVHEVLVDGQCRLAIAQISAQAALPAARHSGLSPDQLTRLETAHGPPARMPTIPTLA